MIGLEFIAKMFDMEYQQIAEHLGITPPAIQGWLKGKRNIPQRRLEQLETLFGIKAKHFQKELTTLEKASLNRKYFEQLSRADGEEVEYSFVDEDGQERTMRTDYNPHSALLLQSQEDEARAVLMEKVEDLINDDESPSQDDNTKLLSNFLKVMQRGNSAEVSALTKVIFYLNQYDSPFGGINATGNEKDKQIYFALKQFLD